MKNKRLVDQIRERASQLWHEKRSDTGTAHVEMWLQAVTETLAKAGYDIVPPETREQEAQLAAQGLEQDYIDALITVTKASTDSPLPLILATSADRLLALKMLETYKSETNKKGVVQ